jgi:hypothetical protein
MPDLPVEPTGHGRYPGDMESRVAVLEQIARTTSEGLAQIVRGMEAQRAESRAMLEAQRAESRTMLEAQRAESRTMQDRLERRMDLLAANQRSDFRWLLGIMLGGFTTLLGAFGAMLGVMAHGLHWL